MSKKDEFVLMADKYLVGIKGPHAKESLQKWRENVDVKAFTVSLNEHPEIRKLFREAVAEAKEIPVEEQAAAGLANLFSGFP